MPQGPLRETLRRTGQGPLRETLLRSGQLQNMARV